MANASRGLDIGLLQYVTQLDDAELFGVTEIMISILWMMILATQSIADRSISGRSWVTTPRPDPHEHRRHLRSSLVTSPQTAADMDFPRVTSGTVSRCLTEAGLGAVPHSGRCLERHHVERRLEWDQRRKE